MTNVYENILGLIGSTPMVRLNKVTADIPAKVYAKLESCNPGHSTKDRIALHIIENAEKKGLLKEGSVIVETTSGNTGFSLAMVSIIKGYKCILAVSDKTKPEKIAYLKALGASVYICPANVPADDPRSYYEVAKRIAEETPHSIYINQYFNELNVDAHYQTTGPEIWEQTQGKITYNDIHSYQIEGMGKALIPSALLFDLVDEFIRVNDETAAYRTREIALKEAILGGYTSGAVTQGLIQYAKNNPFSENDLVVVIYPDHGSRYITKVYSDKWMADQGFSNNCFHNYEEIFKTEIVK